MRKHHAIIELHCIGVSNSMIIKQFKVPKSTVYNTIGRFKELVMTKTVLKVDTLTQLVHPRSSRWLMWVRKNPK